MPSASDPSGECDLAVVGAGILGLGVARELGARHPELSLVVLEKEPHAGAHQTGHNSGVIHAGIYYKPGSLKARLCVEGARRLYEYCEQKEIAVRRCGKLIVALERSQLPGLDELERRGHANGVAGLRRLDGAALREIEPHARGLAALHSPATGIVDYPAVTAAYGADVAAAGGVVASSCAVHSISHTGRRIVLTHTRGELRARHAVFCAGLWSDRLAVAAGASADPRIVPFRGAYLRLRRERRELVRSLIYPVPDPELPFLGVHLTKHIDGNVLVGPTALLAPARAAYELRDVNAGDLAATLAWPGTWRMARRWWRTGLTELRYASSRAALTRAAAQFVPDLHTTDVEPAFAGIRAQALGRDGKLVDDFVFSQTERALHVRNAPSPGATSSLAIAAMIADRAEESFALHPRSGSLPADPPRTH
ncbi:MAG TPA: L-2-hydroxyglutarate oxidase [Solirubrobacteraceae bacterium]|jgi:2-hydroxyglutarate dehydrogenase